MGNWYSVILTIVITFTVLLLIDMIFGDNSLATQIATMLR